MASDLSYHSPAAVPKHAVPNPEQIIHRRTAWQIGDTVAAIVWRIVLGILFGLLAVVFLIDAIVLVRAGWWHRKHHP